MFRKHRKKLSFLFAGSLSIVLAACYGAPSDHLDKEFSNNYTLQDEQNTPIPGLQTIVTSNSDTIFKQNTDNKGQVYVRFDYEENLADYTLQVSDIDSEQNGGVFKTKEINLSESESKITMEKQ